MFTKLLSCIICDSDDQNTSGPERRENHGTLTEICAGRRRAGNGRTDSDHRCKFDPLFWGGYCVYRVKMCGQILLDIQRKVESVYEVKGKNNGRGCFD